MYVLLSVSGDNSDDDLAELQDWLRQEPEFRGRVKPVAEAPSSGELGSVTDLVSVAVGSGGALTALAAALRAYLAQPRRSDVRVTIRAADGRSVEIDGKRVKDVEVLVLGILDKTE